jgi:hypothetical protein
VQPDEPCNVQACCDKEVSGTYDDVFYNNAPNTKIGVWVITITIADDGQCTAIVKSLANSTPNSTFECTVKARKLVTKDPGYSGMFGDYDGSTISWITPKDGPLLTMRKTKKFF